MADRTQYFALCLWCGQPLRSWVSQLDGFGLQCTERSGLSYHERRRLARLAAADLADLAVLDQLPAHEQTSPLAIALRLARARLRRR